MKIDDLTIKKTHKLLKNKEVTSQELTEAYLNRAEILNKSLNSFVTIEKEKSINKAKEIDKKISRGEEIGIIEGVPASLKDIIITRDIRTTAASKMLNNFIPPYNSTVAEKLDNLGSIIIGKNNCDAWAHGASTEHSDFGPAHNPWDLERVPGGSSGGSAIAVAANQSVYSIGTDTGGSIRQPASFCGVVGLKPTYGRISRYGLIAMASSLDVPGPIAKTVEDAAILMELLAGRDEKDSTTSDISAQKYTQYLDKEIKGLRIGVPKEYFLNELDFKIKENIKKAIKSLENQGAIITEVSLPHTEFTVPTYYIIQPAEVSSNLGRYDGIKYGYAAETSNLIDQYFKSRAEGLGEEAKRRIMLGAYTLSSGYYDAYYLKASKVRNLIKQDFDNVFKNVDVLITPTAPSTAFKIGEKEADPVQMYLADVFTAGPSLAGVPAISIPVGFDSKNLPIGMQIIAPHFKEEILIKVGSSYENITSNEEWRQRKVNL